MLPTLAAKNKPAAARAGSPGPAGPTDSIRLQDTIAPAPVVAPPPVPKPPEHPEDPEPSPPTARRIVSRARAVTVIATLAGINFLNTMGSGILIAALPRIATDTGLSPTLILWPAAVYALAAGCLLLVFGAAADAVGAKHVWVTGAFLFAALTLGVGLARTGLQLILFRTGLGVAIAMCLPTSVGLIAHTFPRESSSTSSGSGGGASTWRTVAFAMSGMGQPLGYAVGLVLGGVFTDTVGWRWAFYMMAIIAGCVACASVWSLPRVDPTAAGPASATKSRRRRLAEDVDWLGAAILSVALGMLLYVLAMTTTAYRRLGEPLNIALLALSLALLAVFPWWMARQVRLERPALIPNRLWRNAAFTSICVAVFFCWASLNGIEYFITLYFQQVEGISPLQSSLRFLPHVIMGTFVNIVIGYLVSRVRVQVLVVVSAVITLIAAPLMATVTVGERYWFAPFWALLLSPVNPDVLFTVSNLVISNAYPPEVQSLAGGVFNEVSQFGNSVGLAVTAAIAASVTEHSAKQGPDALMDGYRAAFWTIFASSSAVVVVGFFGLRASGTVGKKNE